MKVHLIKSPEYEVENYQKVVALLKSTPGPIQFKSSSYEFDKAAFYFLQYDLTDFHPFNYTSNTEKIKFEPKRGNPLSWEELFQLCDFYRESFCIPDEDFVILLTNRKNSLNWFSAFESTSKRNIFIHTAEWKYYTDFDKLECEYPIAHQVAENIFQILMEVDIKNIPNQHAHYPSICCINDVCPNKLEVIHKLKSGGICETCIEAIKAKVPNYEISRQLKLILNKVRDRFDELVFETIQPEWSKLTISDNYVNFVSYKKSFKLTDLKLALYVFYLVEAPEEGVTLEQLKKESNKQKLIKIYRDLAPNYSEDKCIGVISDLLSKDNAFSENKSALNRTIRGSLGDNLISSQYIISGEKGDAYKVHIANRNLVNIIY
jgi:hypothetical protein